MYFFFSCRNHPSWAPPPWRRSLVKYMEQKDVDFVEKLVGDLNPLFNRKNVELITILRPQ